MPEIKGLLCIDLWERTPEEVAQGDRFDHWLNDLVKNLSPYKFDSIINAAYHTKIDFNDPSIYNTMVAYNWHEFDEQVMMELIRTCNNFTMSKFIQDTIFGDSTFALYSMDSFLKHTKKLVPHIKDWLVIGKCWKICVHGRPLGLKNLATISEMNFYGADWGFYNKQTNGQLLTADDFENDSINWKQIDSHLYQLQPDIQ